MAELINELTLLGPIEFNASVLLADSALKCYYRAENLNDSGPNSKTLSVTGTVNFAAAKFNNGFSANFTDATNHLTNTSVVAPGTGDITLGCWFKKNGVPTDNFTPTILSIGDSSGTTRCTLEATLTNGYLQTQFVNAGSNTATSAKAICDNVFHFLVMTRIGTAVSLYCDGILVATTTSSKNITGDDILIGYAAASSGFDFIGNAIIDDVFVLNKGLSTSEISTLYGALAYYRFENGVLTTDSKGPFTLTNNNTVTDGTGKFGGAADFGAANTNKSMSIANDLGILGGRISISFWVKLRAEVSSGSWVFVSQQDAGNDVGYFVEYQYNAGTRRLAFYRAKWPATFDNYVSNVTLGTTDWHHIVLTYDGTTVKGYLNGALLGSGFASSGNGSSGGVDDVHIGSTWVPDGWASALIDDTAFWGRDLTLAEIQQIYLTTLIKKVAGVAYASIKKISPTAIAAVKKIAGLA